MKLKLSFLSIAMICAAALFGFYFTMSFVIMPGFDAVDPQVAVISNQQIGRTTKGSLFFLALLGTPIALLVSMFLNGSNRKGRRLQGFDDRAARLDFDDDSNLRL